MLLCSSFLFIFMFSIIMVQDLRLEIEVYELIILKKKMIDDETESKY